MLLSLALLLVLSLSSAAITSVVNEKDKRFEGIRIYLSPSNQYQNMYAAGDTSEMEQCDLIAGLTAEKLEDKGFTVMVGQSGDSMQNRCDESDAFNADLHIPIHTNALNGEYTGGTFVFVLGDNEYALAQSVLDSLAPISPGGDDRIEYKPELYEINMPQAKTVYIECEFHDTEEGANWIINNKDKIAEAICDGICNYYSDLE